MRCNYYTFEHIIKYLSAIRLKKSGQPIKQISILINKLTFQKLESYAFAEKQKFSKIFDHVDLKYDDYKGKIKSNLIKLGREKGMFKNIINKIGNNTMVQCLYK